MTSRTGSAREEAHQRTELSVPTCEPTEGSSGFTNGPNTRRVGFVSLVAALCLGVAGYTLWREDMRYSLPTPRPPDLRDVPLGSLMPVAAWFPALAQAGHARPTLVHFFNPACPCSRFNLTHVNELRARFSERVNFVSVVQTSQGDEELRARLLDLNFTLPYTVDRDGSIAREAGIYSTPQALFLGSDKRVRYRGNYNVARYCTDPSREFVRLAIEAELSEEPAKLPLMPAYGCELPSAQEKLSSIDRDAIPKTPSGR